MSAPWKSVQKNRLSPVLGQEEEGVAMAASASSNPGVTEPLLQEMNEDGEAAAADDMEDQLDPELDPDVPGIVYGPWETVREILAELLWVKKKAIDYKRPWLRFPGHVIEFILLVSILGSIVLLAVDSFDEWDVLEPASECWKTCCLPNIGRCDAETCAEHKDDLHPDSSKMCIAARHFALVRDDLLMGVTIVFTVEYMLRLWTCVELDAFAHSIKGRLKWMATPIAILDLFSIAPFYVIFIMQHGMDHQHHGSTAVFRVMRLMRVLAVLRLERSTKAWRLMMHVFGRKADELSVVVFVTAVFLVLISSLMYYLENETNSEMFPHIPGSMWWAVNCLTTIGYGDVYPKTAAGKVLASFASFVGVGLFALPAGILGAGFTECYTDMKRMQFERRKKRQMVMKAKVQEAATRHTSTTTRTDRLAAAAAVAALSAGIKSEAALDRVLVNSAGPSAATSRSSSVASQPDLMELENNLLVLERLESARIDALEKGVRELVAASQRQEALLNRIADKILVSSY